MNQLNVVASGIALMVPQLALINGLSNDVALITNDVALISNRLSNLEIATARAQNSSVIRMEDVIVPVPDNLGNLPAPFPPTGQEFDNLTIRQFNN